MIPIIADVPIADGSPVTIGLLITIIVGVVWLVTRLEGAHMKQAVFNEKLTAVNDKLDVVGRAFKTHEQEDKEMHRQFDICQDHQDAKAEDHEKRIIKIESDCHNRHGHEPHGYHG